MTFQGLSRLMGFFLVLSALQDARALPMASETPERIERVVLIGLDGLSREGLAKAPTPYLDVLRLKGVFLDQSQGVMPSKSAPNWASILTGVGPSMHGIHSNQWWWFRWRRYLRYPTIFTALKRSTLGKAQTAAVHEWRHFGKLWDADDVDIARWARSPEATLAEVEKLLNEPPRLLVLHLLGIDNAGHDKGWQSSQYLEAVTRVDAQVGALVALLDAKGLRESTLIVIASDHGGVGTKHGGDSPTERLTPVIFHGPTLKQGLRVKETTRNVDLHATLAHVLNVTTLGPRDGRVLREIFESID